MSRLYFTPAQRDRFLSDMYRKLERSRFEPQEMDLVEDITFFGNEKRHAAKLGYDQYFSYTKIFPLFDKKKPRENCNNDLIIWDNIHRQEGPPKAVPATSSQWYGRLPPHPLEESHGKRHVMGAFFTKRRVNEAEPDPTGTDTVPDPRL